MLGLMLALMLVQIQTFPDPGQVVSTIDKTADFGSIRTYAWERGLEVFDRGAHKILIAAIDAELASRGLRQADAQTADVLVTYHGLGSTYVDLDELERQTRTNPSAVAPTRTLGSLAISMRRRGAAQGQRLWLGHARDFVDTTPAKLDASLRAIVARVFSTYPRKAGA